MLLLLQLRQAETGDNNQTSSDETEEGPSSPGFDQQSVAAADCYPMVILEETDTHHLIDQGNGPARSGTPDFRNNHNDRWESLPLSCLLITRDKTNEKRWIAHTVQSLFKLDTQTKKKLKYKPQLPISGVKRFLT